MYLSPPGYSDALANRNGQSQVGDRVRDGQRNRRSQLRRLLPLAGYPLPFDNDCPRLEARWAAAYYYSLGHCSETKVSDVTSMTIEKAMQVSMVKMAMRPIHGKRAFTPGCQ